MLEESKYICLSPKGSRLEAVRNYHSYKQHRKAKGCVYTCLTGSHDSLLNHSYFDKEWDYICYTDDQDLGNYNPDSIWETRPLVYSKSDKIRNSRYGKLHPHEFLQNYAQSIWIDANIDILTPYLFDLINLNSGKSLLIPEHSLRNCIYREIARVAVLRLDDYDLIYNQREFLLKNNMPENYGLNETNIIYRRHNDRNIIKMMNEWWYFLENYSKRDQISLSYVLYKNNINISGIIIPNARIDRVNYLIRDHNNPRDDNSVNLKPLEKIFAVKNTKTHRVIVILGNKIYIKRNLKTKLKEINHKKLDAELKTFSACGINRKKRNPEIIISLTSFPERINEVQFTLYSLLNQTIKADEIILWLATENFPGATNDIPQAVLNLRKNGLTIKWCNDIKSYKKLIPALKEYPRDIIVTADDDLFYPPNWLELLYESYLKEPDYIHAHRAHKIKFNEKKNILPYKFWDYNIQDAAPSFLNFPTSGGGVLYPPDTFNAEVFDEKSFGKLCPYSDDIWFWAMAVLNKKQTRVIEDNINSLTYINAERELRLTDQITLGKINVGDNHNDLQMHRVILNYPIIKEYIENLSLFKK